MLVDVPGEWTYIHIVSIRRISTPHDLGAAVRDARTAVRLTQAELADRAGVSREWLIGLERGARPRAELTKILDVLAVLDRPIMLGGEQESEVPGGDPEPARTGDALSTGEITRRAIERSRRPRSATPLGTSASEEAASAVAARGQDWLSDAMVSMDFAERSAPTGPRADVAALMPRPSPALEGLIRRLSTASTALEDERQDDPDDTDHEGRVR